MIRRIAVVRVLLWVYSGVDSVTAVRQRKSLRRWLERRLLELLVWVGVLCADSFTCCLHSCNQTCAEQQETGRLRRYFDLSSDLSTGAGGVVNVGVGVSGVQS